MLAERLLQIASGGGVELHQAAEQALLSETRPICGRHRDAWLGKDLRRELAAARWGGLSLTRTLLRT